MQKLTQTRPDNCFQTCIASILERPIETLPDQHVFGEREAYVKALRVFLDKHYKLTYVEIGPEKFSTTFIGNVFHVITGETIRTRDSGARHAVVGLGGQVCWDVHPSRDGLIEVFAWGLLVPTPGEWRATWTEEKCLCGQCRTALDNIVV